MFLNRLVARVLLLDCALEERLRKCQTELQCEKCIFKYWSVNTNFQTNFSNLTRYSTGCISIILHHKYVVSYYMPLFYWIYYRQVINFWETYLTTDQFQCMVEWLKHNVVHYPKSVHLWKKTAVKRAELIRMNNEESHENVVWNYPRLFDIPGMGSILSIKCDSHRKGPKNGHKFSCQLAQ